MKKLKYDRFATESKDGAVSMGCGLDIRLVMRHTAPTVELKRRCDVWDVEGRTTAIANVRKITGANIRRHARE